jgi:TolB-like protein/Flp pilus assembly protein TadD
MTVDRTDPPLSVDDRTRLFLSYSHADQAKAEKVIAAFRTLGMEIWWDAQIEAGDAFAKSIETALEAADGVVVLWSRTSIESDWVRDEAARGRDRKRLIPISLDGSEPPLGFRQYQTIDLSKWRGRADEPEFVAVLRRIEALGGPAPPLPITKRRGPTRRSLIGAGAAAVLAGGGTMAWRAGLFGKAASANSVAVLPFKNLSGAVAQDYFSDGLSEELRTMLSSSAQLEVAAQTSSSSAKFKGADARSIATQLGVAYLLDGSVRRAGDTLRIAAQLIEGKTGVERWAQSFDRPATDVLAVQSEIATLVADALAAKLSTDSEKTGTRIGGTGDAAAFDSYLQGKALYRLAESEATDRAALVAFDKAIALDPKYAAAHAAKSRVLTVIGNNYAKGDELKTYYERAIEAARAATGLAPSLAEGQAALGFVLLNGKLDVRGATVPYVKSFELGFGNADILSAFANFGARVGRFEEARRAIARAQKLDPLNAVVFRNAGLTEYCARNGDAAVPPLRTALSLNPKATGVHVVLGDIALGRGDITEALAAYAREPGMLGKLRGLAIGQFKANDLAASKVSMAKLVADFGSNSLYQQAQVLTQWGQKDAAIEALQHAFDAGDSGLVQSKTDPLLDPLRQDRRFVALMGQLGFD